METLHEKVDILSNRETRVKNQESISLKSKKRYFFLPILLVLNTSLEIKRQKYILADLIDQTYH